MLFQVIFFTYQPSLSIVYTKKVDVHQEDVAVHCKQIPKKGNYWIQKKLLYLTNNIFPKCYSQLNIRINQWLKNIQIELLNVDRVQHIVILKKKHCKNWKRLPQKLLVKQEKGFHQYL